jgi:hypothetical protein
VQIFFRNFNGEVFKRCCANYLLILERKKRKIGLGEKLYFVVCSYLGSLYKLSGDFCLQHVSLAKTNLLMCSPSKRKTRMRTTFSTRCF